MNTTTKVILGLTAAAAAGAALGMLLAPEKGTDLQKKIAEGAKDWFEQFSNLVSTGKDLASEFQSKAQHELEEVSTDFGSGSKKF